jgi:predicted metal-dependent phosphoesterase TrpH
LTPGEIVSLARSLDLKAIAITDHDTVDGVRDVLRNGRPETLCFLNGVEISSTPPLPYVTSGSFHILGYGIDPFDPSLTVALDRVRLARTERNPKIITLLNKAGLDITLDEVQLEAGGSVIGRPHMARVLLKKGYVDSIKDAFDRYLAKGKPAYVEKFKMDCEEAIGVLSCAGGLTVLAHPSSLGMDIDSLSGLLDRMIPMGLAGIEAYYPDHSPELTEQYIGLARTKNLLITGGSDFHGSFKTGIAMGKGRGDLCVPFGVYESVLTRLGDLNNKRNRQAASETP